MTMTVKQKASPVCAPVTLELVFEQAEPAERFRDEVHLSQVLQVLHADREKVGVLIETQDSVRALIRSHLEYHLTKPFHRELFVDRTIRAFMDQLSGEVMVLDVTVTIDEAIRQAMARPTVNRYDPVLLQRGTESRLVGIHAILDVQRAQLSESLAEVQKQRDQVRQAEKEREKMYHQMVEASRMAGKAEVATGVLHNVGNVLNSVTTSISCLQAQWSESKVAQLQKLVAMLDEQGDELPAFLSGDERGRAVPAYLSKLASTLGEEHSQMREELNSLSRSVDHMAHVVGQQQSVAKQGVRAEVMEVREVLDEAVRMVEDSYARHGVTLERSSDESATLRSDRHHLIQILVNLLSNAGHAVRDGRAKDRQVKVAVEQAVHDGQPALHVHVEDNGIGIPAEALTQVFGYGYTTKSDGHGFGLHNSANTARMLGGDLQVVSEGSGRGARFTLVLRRTLADLLDPEREALDDLRDSA